MYTRKILLISKLALVALLLLVLARTAMVTGRKPRLFEPGTARGTENKDLFDLIEAKNPSNQDYSAIVQHNIFGSFASRHSDGIKTGPNAAAISALNKTKTALVLLGTVTGNPLLARAIIKNLETNTVGCYRTSDIVSDASIESIEDDKVILLSAGQRRTLTLIPPEFQQKQDTLPHTQPEENESATQIKLVPDSDSQPPIVTQANNLDMLLRKAVIQPYTVNGTMQGLRLDGLQDIPFAASIGLKNGDIIQAVNGQQLSSKQKALQIFKKARSQPAVTVELLRDNDTKTLVFDLR